MSLLYHFISHRLFWLASISVLVLLMSQMFGHMVWQLELFSHYVPHVAILVLLASIIYPKLGGKNGTLFDKYVKRNSYWGRGIFAMVGIALMIWSLQPMSLLPLILKHETSLPKYKTAQNPITLIAYQNVNINNQSPELAIEGLIGADLNSASLPDVIALIEAGGMNWQASLNTLKPHYPTHCGVDESSPFAVQVYAKDRKAKCEVLNLVDFPLVKLTLPASALTNTSLTNSALITHQANVMNTPASNTRIIYVAHPPPPISAAMAHSRNNYLIGLAELIKADGKDQIMVVGDLNTSAFSPIYRDFIRNSQRNSLQANRNEVTNTGLQRTTLNGLTTWMPVMGIRIGLGIDHVLVTSLKNKTQTRSETSDNVTTYAKGWNGSDHRGFKIEWY